MAFTWTYTQDPVHGPRVDTISNSFLSNYQLGGVPWITVETINVGTRALGVESSNAMPVSSITGNLASSFSITFTSALGATAFSFDIEGVVDDSVLTTDSETIPVETITMTPKNLTMGAAATANLAFHHIALNYRLTPLGNPADCVVMVPGTTSQLVKWQDFPQDTAVRWSHPGRFDATGEVSFSPAGLLNPDGETGIIFYDEPSGTLIGENPSWPLASFVQWAYFYNRVTKQGVLFRTTDKVGQGKVFSVTRLSDNTINLAVRFIPPDNSIGNNGASDHSFGYGLEIRPMVGDYYDALVYVREKQKAEGHPAFEKGRIKDRPLVGPNMYPEKARRMVMFHAIGGGDRDYFYANSGTSPGPTSDIDLNVPFNYNRYVQSATRLKQYFELDNWELHCSIYGYWQEVIGSEFPTITFNGTASMAIQQIHQNGIAAILYTIPIHPQKSELPPGLSIYDDMARTRVGYSIPAEPGLDADDEKFEKETPVVGAGNDGLHWTPTFLNDAASLEYLQYVRDQFLSSLGTNFDGFYFDAHNAFSPPPNDDFRLTSVDRGVGSTTWTPKARELGDIAREQLNLDRPIVFTEHPNELYVSNFDYMFDSQIGNGSGTTAVSQPATMWSEYTRFANFDVGAPPDPSLFSAGSFELEGFFNLTELYMIRYSYGFHNGVVASWIQQFNIYDHYFIQFPGEAEYYNWFQASEPFYLFMKRLYTGLKQKVRDYQMSRKLRELPDGPIEFQHRLLLDGDLVGLSTDTDVRVHNSVWYDSDNDVVAVWLSNWTVDGGNATIVQFNKTITRAGWPELGAGPRDVYLTNAETKAQTLIGSYNNGSGTADQYTFNIQVGPGEVFLVEFVPAGTQVSFSEGSAEARIDAAPSTVIHRATRLRYPGYSNFPFTDHFIEADVKFTSGADTVGIWMMGGRKGPDLPAGSVTYDLNPYDYTFFSGADRPLEQNGEWLLSQEPGTNDERTLSMTLNRFQNLSSGVSYYNIQVTATDFNGFTVTTAITPPLNLLNPDSQGEVKVKLRLEAEYVGFSAGAHIFDISAYVENQLMLDSWSVSFPERYFTAVGYPASSNIEGPPIYAGLVGRRSGQYAYGNSSAEVVWESFSSGITGDVTAPPPGTGQPVPTASGEARPKEYLATRYSVPNRARNGGFISYPANLEVQRLTGAIEAVDPTFIPPDPIDVPLHMIILINGSDSMNGGETQRTESFLEQFIRNLPADGTVALTVMSNRNTSSGTYGDIYPDVDLFIPTRLITSDNQDATALLSNRFNAGNGQETWFRGLDAVLSEFQSGVLVNGTLQTGFRKMVLIIDDEGSSDIGVRRSECAAQIDAIHALPGLVECGILSVNYPVSTVIGNGLGQGSWDFIFPRPDTGTVPNTPLVDTNYQTTNYISTQTVPNTQGALVGRTFKFTGSAGAQLPPDAPIIQSPPLQPLTHWPNNAGTYFEYAEWCGYTWAQQVIKRRNEAVSLIPVPPQPGRVTLDAFQALPALEGYSLDIPATAGASVLGHWSVYGASGSVEVAPLDENNEVIPSFDGGNLARVNFGANGEVRFRQEIVDSRPFRGQRLSMAYTGRFFEGRVRVDMVLEVDGEEQIFHTAYSSNFGTSARWVENVLVPLNFNTLAVTLKLTGKIEDAVGLSGVQIALGEFNQFLPYSEPPEDSIIAPGTVVMTTGDSCPPGYREVPGSAGRLAFGFAGDPNFFKREFVDSITNGDPGAYVPVGGGTPTQYPHEMDLVFCIDWSSSQRNNSNNRNTVKTWVKEMLQSELPRDGTVRVGMVAHANNIPGGAVEIFPMTQLDFTTATSLASLVDTLPTGGANGDRYAEGLQLAKTLLESTNDNGARLRAVFCNFDTVFDDPLENSPASAARDALHTMPRFSNLSIVAVGASRQAMLNAGFEPYVFPSPSSAAPGILFAATGGFPGTALPGSFNGQPFLAGEYAAQVLGAHVRDAVLAGFQFQNITGFALTDGLGGQRFHEHSEGEVIGSSIFETDGFEPPLLGETITPTPIPLGQTAAIKPYPFGFNPNVTRPEDPPVIAVGPGHAHSVMTDMEALPPSFPVRYCEKL